MMNNETKPQGPIVVMGVSGCGKSSVGAGVAAALEMTFVEGDAGGHPDGLRVDTAGRVWTSWGSAIRIYAPRAEGGELLGTIRLPETVANLAFGGPDGGTLAITATSVLYRVATSVQGCTR